MANPFLAAINSVPTGNDPYASPNYLPSVLQNAQSQARGVDLSGFDRSIPMPSALTQDLVNSGSWGRSTSAPVLPAALTPQAQSSSPGFWGGLWNRISGPFEGAMAQMMNDGPQQMAIKGKGPTPGANGHLPLAGLIPGFIHGLTDNAWAHQAYAQAKQGQMDQLQQQGQQMGRPQWMTNVDKTLLGGALDTYSNPLTYVPFGTVAKVSGAAPAMRFVGDLAKGTVKGAEKVAPEATGAAEQAAKEAAATGESSAPYAAYGWQSKIGPPIANTLTNALPNGLPGVKPLANGLEYLFKPISGARQYFVNGVGQMHGTVQSGINQALTWLRDLAQRHSLNTFDDLTHAMESTAPGTVLDNPVLNELAQKVEPILEHSKQFSLDHNLISNTIDPEELGVGRYIPHVSASKLDENAAPFSDITTRRTSVDASKNRTLEGTIQTINAKGGPQFETNLLKILGFHLTQMYKAAAVRDLINTAMEHSLPEEADLAGKYFPGTVQKAMQYSHDGKTVWLPESEARYLQGIANPKSEEGKQFWTKLYRGAVNFGNKSMFLTSPFVHILNNLGTQTLVHAPSVLPKMFNPFSPDTRSTWKEAFTGVKPGSPMDQALQSGALHLTSSSLGKGTTAADIANQAAKFAEGGTQNPFLRVWNFYNNLTPNTEKVYRTFAFGHGLEKGMTPEESANMVRRMYGGEVAPGTAAKAEAGLRSVMPFVNWTKTAIGSNAGNFLTHPLPYVAGYNALNNYNEAQSGHPMWQNPNPLSIALPWNDKNGNPEYWAPYAPPFDVGKLLNEAQTGGIPGVADFAYKRANPIARFIGQLFTGEQDPLANPGSKFTVDPYPGNTLIPPQGHQRGIFFGDQGPKLPPYPAQLAQDVMNPFATINDAQNKGLRDTLLSQLFGGSISAPNPASKQKQQNYQNKQDLQQFRGWLKKQGQGG